LALRQLLHYRRLAHHHAQLLGMCDTVISHAAHHSAWLRRHGVPQATYIPPPVTDYGGEVARQRACTAEQLAVLSRKLRIVMVGSTSGIASLSGFPGLIRNVLPALDEEIGDGYELHLIGAMTGLPSWIEKQLQERTNVIIRGYVEDIADEFRKADVLLVPTPIDLGFRIRIAEAFSYGCCVVAHTANSKGMPELQHGENILLADSGLEMALACRRVLTNPSLGTRLGIAGRHTFERHYNATVVCSRMTKIIEASLQTKQARCG
jgi:hypothetical protein